MQRRLDQTLHAASRPARQRVRDAAAAERDRQLDQDRAAPAVRIALDPKELAAHPLRIGLSMDVDADTRDDSGTQLAAAVNTTYRTDVFARTPLARGAPGRSAAAFARWLAPLRTCEWVVYAKRPFAGPKAVLEYLSRYTHRVAISNQRLVAFDERGVTFRWKDYRATGRTRYKTMTLEAGEFMRRFLLHVLPGGFHRIRHYGLLANPVRRPNLAKVRELLGVVPEI